MTTQREAILLVEQGPTRDGPILLDRPLCVFGKSPSSDVEIESPFVSRSHFQIRHHSGQYSIQDLGSKNGTYLNSELLEPHRDWPLRDGDRIALAEDVVVLRFRDSDDTMTRGNQSPTPTLEIRIALASREVWVRDLLLAPPLSRKEFDILNLLYQRRGDAVSRDEIAAGGWPERTGGDVGDQEIDQCVRRIRRRVELDPHNPTLIVTLRGFGYRMP